MAKVAGIKVEKIVKGKPTIVRIDLRKHPEFIPLLEEKGIVLCIEKVEDKELLKLMKDVDRSKKVSRSKIMKKLNT
jgi:hypothetical protein